MRDRRPTGIDSTIIGVMLAMLAGAEPADAQGLGYAVAGPAGFSGFFGSSAADFHAAGGGEFLVNGRAGPGAEVGLLGNSSSRLLVLSLNGAFHFPTGSDLRRPSPFVTGGYTHMGSGEGGFNAWNVGAGLDVWMSDQYGLRVEFRNHVRPDVRGTVHYWTVRAGVVGRSGSNGTNSLDRRLKQAVR
jgi:hypothetical protein